MLRLVIWMLVLANAGYFAWTQGYLAAVGWAPAEQTEPERLQAQIQPGSLRLLNSAKPATGALPPQIPMPPAPVIEQPAITPIAEPTVSASPTPTLTVSAPEEPAAPRAACWQANGYTPVQADSLRAALALLDLPRGSWALNEAQTGGRWVVYMGRYNEEQMERKKTELREINVEFREVSVPSLSPGLALGTYSSEASARQALQDVIRKGVRTARVAQERAESTSWALRLPAVTDTQRAAVASLGAPLAGKPLQRCD